MIEISRYILAVVVVQTHLWSSGTDFTGQISVFAFYTLSGFLITRVLNERYGFSPRGTVIFLVNRVLRLWPAYLVILALVILALQYLPLTKFFPLIRVPDNTVDIITNLAIFGQTTFDFLQWIPRAKPLVTSWSLSIEVFCYLLLAAYFAKSSARLWLFAALGLVAMTISTMWCEATPFPYIRYYGPYCFQNRYGVLQAGFIPFAFGGLYYFHRGAIEYWLLPYRAILMTLITGAVLALFVSGDIVTSTVAPYIGIPLTWMLLASAPDKPATYTQDFLGRASYHLFIAHMPLAAILVTGFGVPVHSVLLYLAAVIVALGLSAFLVPMEWLINRLRRQLSRTQVRFARPSPALV